MHIPKAIQAEISAGAIFIVNHSGGKDSQAMTIKLRQAVPANQLIVIHADLAEVEWPGTESHARATTQGLPFHVVKAPKTFFDMVEHRQMFPSPRHRQCTSDLKRTPVATWIRRHSRATGNLRYVNCLGLRAEESTDRARRPEWKFDKRQSKAGRHVLEWLPIQDMLIDEVFETIAQAGQKPHWAYAAGMSRLSCCFCIMASKADLTRAAKLRPRLYDRYVELEKRLNHTLSPSRKGLESITGITACGATKEESRQC